MFVKCTFASHQAQYLGHILGHNFVKPLTDKLAPIKNFPVPKTRKNIRQILEKKKNYRKFIPNSTTRLEPLHNLLQKGIPFFWFNDCQTSFDEVKELSISEPILTKRKKLKLKFQRAFTKTTVKELYSYLK